MPCRIISSSRGLAANEFLLLMCTKYTILGVFRTHAQKECSKVWEMKSADILNILAILFFFKTSNAFTHLV